MTDVVIRLAENQKDFETARSLCREWLDWHWRNYPTDWPKGPDHPMDPVTFEATIQELPLIHKPPSGGVLIGLLNGEAVGCVMYNEAKSGIAEFNRLFVNEKGRGHRMGHRMLEAMFVQLSANGCQKVFFSSAKFLTHARAMYEAAGFVKMPHPSDFPKEWRDYTYFMERDLSRTQNQTFP